MKENQTELQIRNVVRIYVDSFIHEPPELYTFGFNLHIKLTILFPAFKMIVKYRIIVKDYNQTCVD